MTQTHVFYDSDDGLRNLFRYAQVGQCVSSVTHDVNNHLGAIMAYSELIALDDQLTPESKRMVREMHVAVRRSSNLLTWLTDIARRDRQDIRVVDPNSLLNRILSLRQYDLKMARVAVDVQVNEELACFTVDLPKIEQALLYVLTNALEAVEARNEKQLRVRMCMDDPETLHIAIWNSGAAIPESDFELMFEPFFTTKGPAHPGLGLTIARQAIEEHSGTLVYEPNNGFVFRLPRYNRYTQSRPGAEAGS